MQSEVAENSYMAFDCQLGVGPREYQRLPNTNRQYRVQAPKKTTKTDKPSVYLWKIFFVEDKPARCFLI